MDISIAPYTLIAIVSIVAMVKLVTVYLKTNDR